MSKIHLPYDTAVPFLGIFPKEMKPAFEIVIHIPILTAAQFTTAKLWDLFRYLLIGDWIKKMRYIYTVEYHSAVKKDGILFFALK